MAAGQDVLELLGQLAQVVEEERRTAGVNRALQGTRVTFRTPLTLGLAAQDKTGIGATSFLSP